MFNGIIFNQGVINKIIKRDKGIDIFVKSNLKLTNKDMGCLLYTSPSPRDQA